MPRLSNILKKDFGYDFNIQNKSPVELVNEIIQLLSYLKILYDKKDNFKFFQPIKNETPLNLSKKTKKTEFTTDGINFSIIENSRINTNNNNSILLDSTNYKFIDFQNQKNNLNVLRLLGTPSLIKDSRNFYYYKLFKLTNPIVNIEIGKGKGRIKKMKFIPNSNANEDYEIFDTENQKQELEKMKEKEELILNFLYDCNIINEYQKRTNYFFKKILPKASDGVFIGDIINILEGKKEKVLKGISKETYYRNNIKINFDKICNFLNQKESFKSKYLFKDEFYNNQNDLFEFIYEIISYYLKYRKNVYEQIKKRKQEREHSPSFIKQICENKYPLSDVTINNASINTSQSNICYIIDKASAQRANSIFEHSFKKKKSFDFSTPNLDKFCQDKNFNKKELMDIRKNIYYQHYTQRNNEVNEQKEKVATKLKKKKSLIPRPFISKRTIEEVPEAPVFGKDNSFDRKVCEILYWLDQIGIKTPVDFYQTSMGEFQDGVLLYQIIKKLETDSKILPRIDFNPKNATVAINNIRVILVTLSQNKKQFPVNFLNKQKEIFKAYPMDILELLFSIKSIYSNEKRFLDLNRQGRNLSNSFSVLKPGNSASLSRLNNTSSELLKRKSIPMTKGIRQNYSVMLDKM